MQTLSLYLCLFLGVSFTAVAQTATDWPCNAKTGKVELRGAVRYPASIKTEAGRRAFVRQWYMRHLTNSSPTQLAEQEKSNATNGLLTYAGLPKFAVIKAGQEHAEYLISYQVAITPTAVGFSYLLTGLDFDPIESDQLKPIEETIKSPTENEQAALHELQARLAKAGK